MVKKRKLRRKIAEELVEKFPYWNTCPNEREMILDIVLSKKDRGSWESHCKMDCSINWCECHPKYCAKAKE